MNVQMLRTHLYSDPVDRKEDAAVTVRPSSTSLFCVDSADRYDNITDTQFGLVSPYKFSITKNEALLNGFFKRIALTEFVFPYYIPNINATTSSFKLIYNGGAEVTLTIPSTSYGFYTPTALATLLQPLLIALTNPGATITYLSTGRFQISVGGGNSILVFPSNTSNFGLFDLIGGVADWYSIADPIITGKVTRCRITEFIDVVCSQLTYNQNLKDGSSDPVTRDILARIYLECENDQPIPVLNGSTTTTTVNTVPGTYPFTIYRQFKNPKQIRWDKTQPLGNLTFQLFDSYGNQLTGGGNNDWIYPDWRMTLLVSED